MRNDRRRLPSQDGFTLIEAIVVMTILVVLAGASAASFTWLNQTTRIRSAAFDLVADLDFARSEAIKRNADVVVAPDTSWNNGWVITVGDTTLRQRGGLGAQVEFVSTPDTVTYDGGGRATLANPGAFQLCPPTRGNLSGRTIQVDPSGRSRSSKSKCE